MKELAGLLCSPVGTVAVSHSSPAPSSSNGQRPHDFLRRDVGPLGAVMLGLGSILGTGIFVSIGIAAGIAGSLVLVAIAVAGCVAACNGLSSAQLAANHPVSGGTYEYGYRWLHPSLGFTAGWMFLCAKSASAATAALGFAGYALNTLGLERPGWMIPLAVAGVVVLTGLALSGIRRSYRMNIVIVSITLASLLFFIIAGLPDVMESGTENPQPMLASLDHSSSRSGLLEACALMFVAYTGYGRIATLGEEINSPRRNIPIAILATLFISMALYLAVGLVAIASVGPGALAEATGEQATPLQLAARQFPIPMAGTIMAVGAVTAMLGVLLNLILGLSRVVLAMGRRRDIPAIFSRLNQSESTPYPAVILVGAFIVALTLLGNVKTIWSFSAFTVLVYYAITNLAAVRLGRQERLYPRIVPWLGLFSCLFLAFWVEPEVWMMGLGLIALGLVWHGIARRFNRPESGSISHLSKGS